MMTTTTDPTKKPDYVYVTYIATTPEKVWRAITDPDVARAYWADPKAGCSRVNVSDWKEGSRWEHRRADGSDVADVAGRVIESTPPKRLVISWARPAEFDDASLHSRVTFEIEPYSEGLVQLTVMHDDLAKDPKMFGGVSDGWPKVLSNLKTLLESGKALPKAEVAAR